MIRRILVALDPDTDSLVATQYAVRIARDTGARVTGLAVVDTKHIKQTSRGGGIGSMYYAEKLRENLTQETRDQAHKLIADFERYMEGSSIDHVSTVEEGVPFERIVEDMKYHDLLIMGCDPHFFYGHPKQRTNTFAGVFHHAVGPTLVVAKAYRDVKRIVFATNGENSSARALQRFVAQKPFGTDVEFDVLTIHDENQDDARLHLELTKDYLEDHGYSCRVSGMSADNRAERILAHAEETGADLILAGSNTTKGVTGLKLSQTTDALTDNQRIPVFVHH